MTRFVEAMEARKAAIAEELTKQMGRPIRYTPGEVGGLAERSRYMTGAAPAALADEKLEPKENFTRFIRHEPLGVVFVVASEKITRNSAKAALDQLESKLVAPVVAPRSERLNPTEVIRDFKKEDYLKAAAAAKEYIAAGDVYQLVLSSRFSGRHQLDPFQVYRALRLVNPSPYMFFFDFGTVDGEPLHLCGSSPEMFVRLEGRTASLRPIAGTRPRGKDNAADDALAQELLADPKERAEHVMLVDLGRNDLGRVCE